MAISATSLAAVNELAANPPQYPHNPAEDIRDPLTLYISRVPGTRDVILSTFKPQRKNVTAEDIANALYYVHLDSPSDSLLLSIPVGHGDGANGGSSPRPSGEQFRASPIQRKPLPSSTRAAAELTGLEAGPLPNSLDPIPPPLARPAEPAQSAVPEVRPELPPRPEHAVPSLPPDVSGGEEHTQEHMAGHRMQDTQISRAPILRKPIGPRPLAASNGNGSETLGVHAPAASMSYPQMTSPRPPPLPPRPSSPSTSMVPFQLTLIRRDPSTSHQWNVGKVSSLQPVEPVCATTEFVSAESHADTQVPKDYQAVPHPPMINIRLDTSGYAKFRNFPTRLSIENASRDFSKALQAQAQQSQKKESTKPMDGKADVSSREDGPFTRQVAMSYSKSWTANIRNAFRRHERSSSSASLEGGLSSSSSLNDSQAAAAETDDKMSDSPIITRPGPGLKQRGYVFASPWDGLCEFRTGNGGRSLKCRHCPYPSDGRSGGILAGIGGPGGYNPLVIAQNSREALGATGRARAGSLPMAITGMTSVSELRFNLPSGDLLQRGGGDANSSGNPRERDPLSWAAHRRHHPHRRTFSSDSDEEDEQYSEESDPLSLGREAAGGGNRGKRAKLGKLIIFHDGFKMLDLVVAANMGMWWVSWERSARLMEAT